MKSTVADWKYPLNCLRIEAQDGDILYFSDHPHDILIGNNLYLAGPGYQFTGVEELSSGAAPVIDLEGILLAAGITRAEIREEKWSNAFCYAFRTSWDAPVEDEEPLGKAVLGKFIINNERFKTELINVMDLLNQPIGANEVPTCRWTLFDETLDGRSLPYQKSRCGLSLAANKVTGTITGVTDRFTFADSSRTEADDYFGNGEVKFTSGLNNGLKAIKIKSHTKVSPGGTFSMHDAAKYPIAVGDTYEMAPGCRGRKDTDCVTKWSNGENFSSSTTVPTADVIAEPGTGV